MEKRLGHEISNKKDRVMISKRIPRSSSNNLEHIQPDLQILSKLPIKFIGRFRCVSRDLASILRISEFTNQFLEMSSSRPHLLFTVKFKDRLLFFSAPQPLNLDKNSSFLSADYHMSFPLPPGYSRLHAPVKGLLCTESVMTGRGCEYSKVIIYNPSTGQSLSMKGQMGNAITFCGYDPINTQYKVLCMSIRRSVVIKHEVLTLGMEKPAWRMIECSLPQHFPYSPICINGVLYYLGDHGKKTVVVCFDVRSEKFKSIETNAKVNTNASKLINYKGKLGVFHLGSFTGETKGIELLVLNDVEKDWSQHIYVFPPLWKDLIANMTVYIVGVSDNGEFVFCTAYDPLHIFFYNVEKNTIARVRIQGMKTITGQYI